AGLLHGAAHAEQARAGRLRRADRGERRAALEDDVRDVRERLDVVDDGGLAEEARLDRERRLVARLAAVPLDRVEERGLLAADVGAGALAELDVEAEAGAGHVVAEPAVFAGLLDRVRDALERERVLAAEVDVTVLGADGERGDRHGLDDREGVALEQDAVLERAGLGFVRVADDVARARRLPRDSVPLPAGGERGAAAPEQAGVRDLADDGGGSELDGALEGGEAAGAAVVVDVGGIDGPDAAQQPERAVALLRQAGPGPVRQRARVDGGDGVGGRHAADEALDRLGAGDREQRGGRLVAEAETRAREPAGVGRDDGVLRRRVVRRPALALEGGDDVERAARAAGDVVADVQYAAGPRRGGEQPVERGDAP